MRTSGSCCCSSNRQERGFVPGGSSEGSHFWEHLKCADRYLNAMCLRSPKGTERRTKTYFVEERLEYKSQQPFTLGIWTVKVGRERAFTDLWTSFARWTSVNFPAAGTGYLLQDDNKALRFISFGPWENTETVRAWREHPEFKSFAAKVKDLCDDFQPISLSVVASSKD